MSSNTALTTIQQDIYGTREPFQAALVDTSIHFDSEAGFALQQLAKNDFSLKTAMANRQSVVDAVVNIAAIGVSLNPAKRQAYLVPRDNRICLDISYIGLVDMAVEGGAVQWAKAELVYEADQLTLRGIDLPPEHRRDPFAKDRGEVIGVYCVAKLKNGDYLTETMSIDEVNAIRDRSASWKNGQKGPWKTDPGEMIKKTVLKRASKMWPKSDRLASAINHLNELNDEGLAELADHQRRGATVISAVPKVELSPEREQVIQAVAEAILDRMASDDLVGAFGEYEGVTDEEEKSRLWKLLPSGIRSAIKAHGQKLRAEGATDVEAKAA